MRSKRVGSRIESRGSVPHHQKCGRAYVQRLCHSDLLTLKGHRGGVHSASFSADGTRIVTASHDQTAKVWDAKTGIETLTLTLTHHTNWVESASFSPDGTRIVTASGDAAKVWGRA